MNENSDLLKFIIKIHREEVQHHLTSIGSVFYWTITIILGITVAIFGASANDMRWSAETFDVQRWVIVGSAISANALIVMLAVREMMNAFKGVNENAKVVSEASGHLGFFDSNKFGQDEDSIYNKEWKEWGDPKYRRTKIVPKYHVFVVIVLAFASCFISVSLGVV